MSVKVRPITQADKKVLAPSERQMIRSSPMISLDKASMLEGNVVSDSIFGTRAHSEDDDAYDKIFEDRYTRVGYINLTKPVLNPFLAGRKAPVWRTVLGKKEDAMMSIINGYTIYDAIEDVEYPLSKVGQNAFDPERYLYGADYLKYLLGNVDLQQLLEDQLIRNFVVPCMDRSELAAWKAHEFNVGRVYTLSNEQVVEAMQGGIEGWMFGCYALDMSESDFSLDRREEIDIQMADNMYISAITDLTQFPIISLLTGMINNGGVAQLESQILEYVYVLPMGFRPTIENRVDAITSQYNKLENVNLELRDILDQPHPTVYTVINKYRELVQYVRNIFIGDEDIIKQQGLKDYKSLSDMITGKKGLMRSRMQGARVDYSGRTVISCDPNMPIDCVGVPRKILRKIAEPGVIKGLRNYVNPASENMNFKNRNLATFSTTSSAERDGITYDEYLEQWFSEKERYVAIGRQPTLFYLGLQGFKVIPVDGDALVLSPLCVMPFNADFDGDQMHVNMPTTPAAVRELRNRIATGANMYYPKNGELRITARHEIIYGLWMSNRIHRENAVHYSTEQIVSMAKEQMPSNCGVSAATYQLVCSSDLNIYDVIEMQGRSATAGTIALEYAIFGGVASQDLSDFKVKAKKINQMLEQACGNNRTAFLSSVNRLVKLGFAVAVIWPPNVTSVITPEVKQTVEAMIEEFRRDIHEREEYLNIGIEIESEFTAYFNNGWDALKKKVTDYLLDSLGEWNGYISMMQSGGKGDKNNILQIFGLKGRVQKNDITAFNSIISGSYARELTGLEGFVSAYGSRKGIADKVLATAEPGYMSRKLEHSGSIISILWEDCQTTNGICFTLEDIVPFIDESQTSKYGIVPPTDATDAEVEMFWNRSETQTQLLAARDYLAKILIGRYVVGDDGTSVRIDDYKMACWFIDSKWGHVDTNTHTYIPAGDGVVKMRSPIYCEKPCCRVCYGKDLADNKFLPDIGRPVGFIAAQAIGEPGTQLTMNNFHKGGVLTEANLTSSFSAIEDYLELHDLSKKMVSKRGVRSYDVISPREGYVKEQYLGNGSKRILVTKTADPKDRANLIPGFTKIIVHENTKLKHYVRVGDSFQQIQGSLNMKEVLQYRGYDKAASYLTLMLYSLFSTQDVNIKHFECIVADMSRAYILNDAEQGNEFGTIKYGEGSSFKAGSLLSRQELYFGTCGQTALSWTLIGIKNLPKYASDFFESLLMENMDSYVPRAILMNPNDSMTNPITLTAFGLPIGVGTDMQR